MYLNKLRSPLASTLRHLESVLIADDYLFLSLMIFEYCTCWVLRQRMKGVMGRSPRLSTAGERIPKLTLAYWFELSSALSFLSFSSPPLRPTAKSCLQNVWKNGNANHLLANHAFVQQHALRNSISAGTQAHLFEMLCAKRRCAI